jgi:hypothetical protein
MAQLPTGYTVDVLEALLHKKNNYMPILKNRHWDSSPYNVLMELDITI